MYENDKNTIIKKFDQAIKQFRRYQPLLERGFFLPEDLVQDFISIIKEGTDPMKVTSLKLMASFAMRNQITSISPEEGARFLKQAADISNQESANTSLYHSL